MQWTLRTRVKLPSSGKNFIPFLLKPQCRPPFKLFYILSPTWWQPYTAEASMKAVCLLNCSPQACPSLWVTNKNAVQGRLGQNVNLLINLAQDSPPPSSMAQWTVNTPLSPKLFPTQITSNIHPRFLTLTYSAHPIGWSQGRFDQTQQRKSRLMKSQ